MQPTTTKTATRTSRIWIFNHEIQYFCTLCTCMFHFCGLSLVETSTHYVIALKEWVKEWVSYFRVVSSGTLGSSDILGSADQPANEAMIFHVAQSLTATNCRWNEKVSYRCLTMNLYSFVSITRHTFLSTYQIVVSKEFWRLFDAVRGFYINSAPESNSLLGGNGGCVPLTFLHYCRRGNSVF